MLPPLSASNHRSSLFARPDRTSRFDVPGPVPQLRPTPAPSTSAPGLRFVFHQAPARSRKPAFSSQVLTDHRPVSISPVETLRRASGVHASPVCAPFPSLGRGPLWMRQHPRVYRFSVRSTLTLSNGLTSWLSRQDLLRLVPGCQSTLTDRSCSSQFPDRTRSVSFVQLRLCGVLWSARYPCQPHVDSFLSLCVLRA